MTDTRATFLTGNLFRHIAVMSLTSTVGLMAIFLVDLVDMVFISMLGRDELAAAVGYAGAILFFTSSFGIGMAIAAGALTARALGSGDMALARQRATNTLALGVLLSMVFAAAIWWQVPRLTALVGASGVTQELATGYLRIIVPSLPLLLVGMAGGAVLRAHGNARAAMMATVWGGAVNAVLDPVLIFGLGLDLTGAAIASVAARVAMAAAALWPLLRRHDALSGIDGPSLAADLSPVLRLAIPAVLTQFATPVGQAYVTRSMAQFGEDAVAGMAIAARLTPVAFAVIFALSGAVGPIIGQNAGAGETARVRRTYREALWFTALVVAVATAVLFGLRGPIADLFGATGTARDIVFLFCGPLALMFFFNGMIFVGNAAFNNLGHPFWSTWVNWGRHTLGTVPFVILGAAIWGAEGVLLGQAAGGVVFAVLSAVLVARAIARADRPSQPRPFQREARLMQILHLRR
ncbi:MATE family efflux transporter [Rhodobacterales bacterium HKCCE2091]|nr:MATE family efflux transporter [Rhodobacterales bacterium HKCCE2091]